MWAYMQRSGIWSFSVNGVTGLDWSAAQTWQQTLPPDVCQENTSILLQTCEEAMMKIISDRDQTKGMGE